MLKTFLVDGDKGGVGKTMVSRVITDVYVRHAEGIPKSRIICIDADHTNPDFAGDGGYKKDDHVFASFLANLDEPDSWLDLTNRLEGYLEMAQEEEVRIIINLPATIQRAFMAGGETVGQVMEMFNCIPIWVLGDTADSVTQLQKRYEVMGRKFEHGVAVVNLKFGLKEKFTHWNGSNIRKEIIDTEEWMESSIPVLSPAIARKLGRTPFHIAEENRIGADGAKLGLGDMVGVRAFRNSAASMMTCIEKLGEAK
ncbi:MAG: hypothetical protein ACYCZR_00625 [Burkholderiales bacterium]